MATNLTTTSKVNLYEPATRDKKYQGNFAQYLVDLHDARATFNFCGGMMFQFVLSDKLRERLAILAQGNVDSLVVHAANFKRMQSTPNYSKSSTADNHTYFHGREIRKAKGAAGGLGFVLHLSDTENDPEGWTSQERKDYNGWGHDSGRPWRKLKQWETEGVKGFKSLVRVCTAYIIVFIFISTKETTFGYQQRMDAKDLRVT